ncbi:MAG: penicillin acylase family protein [Gemmatimonadaceae bacterium]|nr:penicillin acylase family protein [Gemmatimonadaceae bacterium]
MTKLALLLAAFSLSCTPLDAADTDAARWARQARDVTITRDDHGIAHVRGRTDADAVFGLMYAQAEDDFNRIETNYLNAMGRLAEAEGSSAIYRDLRMKLFVNPDSIRAQYAVSPPWLKSLMMAWADGLNFYLATHRQVKPRVITRFEPWMALTFSEGSIGGDIETVSLRELEAFYGKRTMGRARAEPAAPPREPSGSNGFAIAPANTANRRALLLINPHTSFFFRSEVQVTSGEGLNAYGAVTWGQFFVYQGFNERAGWMHTSSGADAIDEYLETVERSGDQYTYRFGTETRPVTATRVVVPFRTRAGMARKEFTVYRTHHGPVVRDAEGKWVTVRLMQEPLKALTQSFTRTKARGIADFRASMELHTNSSNNTIYADADGNIAYFHANFVPRRDTSFDWSRPVDGSDPATEWKGIHSIDESPLVINPGGGWLYNTNNWPYSAAGTDSPRRDRFPSYMDRYEENPRGIHAMRVLKARTDFTLPTLIEAAYDTWLPAFADLLPTLLASYDELAPSDPRKASLSGQIAALRGWDHRWSESSVPTSLAVYWGDELWSRVSANADSEDMSVYDFIGKRATSAQRLEALATASGRLTRDFGRWQVPWGEINRFQRITGDIVQPFDDAKPSIPVGFTSSRWGSLASFGARTWPGTRKMYGTSGNSFVAVVEFGDSVRAKAVTAGGESGHPASPHFNDQAMRYSKGNLRDVYFYPSQLRGHVGRRYRPGQ